MLTGKLVRVRYYRDRIIPAYLDPDDPHWLESAERLLEVFREREGTSRGELADEVAELSAADPRSLVHQGLAKLLEDRCEFEVVAECPPEELREAVFLAAAKALYSEHEPAADERPALLRAVGEQFGLDGATVASSLFADLKSEQRLVRFKDITAERLLHRYNEALAQAVLLRSTGVQIRIRNEKPARYRQLLRLAKFHRLLCETERAGIDSYRLSLDGPLSLFSATQKYGLQLALFLPAVLLCKEFELRADLRWGPKRVLKTFRLTEEEGLVSHLPDTATYTPPELRMFVDLFRQRIKTWEIDEEAEVFPLGDGSWVPDFRLTHRASGKVVYFEVLGFWRRSHAERHLERLREHAAFPFLLAVSDQLRIEEQALEGLPAGMHRFRQMPLPAEVARLADALLVEPPPRE